MESQRRILRRIQERDIVPKHQVLKNEISKAYKEDILATGITFHLALPDDHRRNIAENPYRHGKTTLSAS